MPGRIVLLIGLPGSGKSTYLERRGLSALSSDEIRRLLTDDAADQTANREVFATLRYLLRRRLDLGRPVTYIDATNLTRYDRRPYLKLGRLYGCRMEAIFFDAPIEVCQQRNRRRGRVVPADAIERMAARLAPPSPDEALLPHHHHPLPALTAPTLRPLPPPGASLAVVQMPAIHPRSFSGALAAAL